MSKRVLVVDDDESYCGVIQPFLQCLGYSCEVARDAGAAVQWLQQVAFDLVIAAISIPGKDGIELMQEARKTYPDLDFILMSGYAEKYFYTDIIAAGATDLLVKPFELGELQAKIKRLNREKAVLQKMQKEISTRQQIEKDLRASEEKQRLLLSQIPAVPFRGYADGSVEAFTEKIEALTGYGREDFASRRLKWTDLILSDDLPEVKRRFLQALKHNQVYGREYRIRRRFGDIIWIQEQAQIFCDTSGRIDYVSGMFFDITEQKKTESRLDILETAVRQSIDGIAVANLEGVIQFANAAWSEMHDYAGDELIGKHISIFHSPEQMQQEVIPFNQAALENGSQQGEVGHITRKGAFFPTYMSSSLLRNEKGEPVGWVGVARDITKQKAMEEELRKAHDELEDRVKERTAALSLANTQLLGEIEERLQTEGKLRQARREWEEIFQAVGHPIVILDPQHRIIAANRATIQARGLTEAEILGKKCFEVFHSGTEQPADGCPMEKLLSSGRLMTVEMEQEALGGIYIVTCTPVPDDQGRLEKIIHVATDITAQKQAEGAIRQSKIQLQMAFDGIPEPLIMVDRHMRPKVMNQAAIKYYQVSTPQDVQDKYCYEFFQGGPVPCAGGDITAAVLTGKNTIFERKGFKDPDRIEQVYVYSLGPDAGSEGNAVIRITDVTESRLMERQMVQSEKLASLGMLVAGVAHEINNPNSFITFNIPILRSYLHQIISFMDDYAQSHPDFALLGMSYPDFREDIFKLVDNFEHGSSRINATVSALRDFARERGQGEKSWVDLKAVLEKAVAICRGRINKLVGSFLVNLPDELPVIITDSLALEQVLINLLINAAQAADKDNSWIKLNVSWRELEPKQIIIEVSDNGCGMDAATRRRIFDPFFTTKGLGVGTGLGLPISHRLVEELGGHIEVSSEVGQGSTFRVILDLEKESAPVMEKEI